MTKSDATLTLNELTGVNDLNIKIYRAILTKYTALGVGFKSSSKWFKAIVLNQLLLLIYPQSTDFETMDLKSQFLKPQTYKAQWGGGFVPVTRVCLCAASEILICHCQESVCSHPFQENNLQQTEFI